MKNRDEIARFIESQFNYEHETKFTKGNFCNYGCQEVRELMDFVFEGPPKSEEEKIFNQGKTRV